jgi:amylosucrase
VGPRDLVPYLGQGRHEGRVSHLAYHNNLMVQFWSSLASRDTRLMAHVLRTHFPESFRRASFATYLRCHDDIGWAITEEDAPTSPTCGARPPPLPGGLLQRQLPGQLRRGADFQSNPETGDRRTNGSLASLAASTGAASRRPPLSTTP